LTTAFYGLVAGLAASGGYDYKDLFKLVNGLFKK
jgi:hypothetical protein